jgi:S-DNA-T family DNA segregation ATPase FtsK/SpoIIIE
LHDVALPPAVSAQRVEPMRIIEPMAAEPVISDRVTKEKQKPLFAEMADGKLPQIDLLDAAPGRTETITTESWR